MIQIKNAAEIEKMRRACAISAAALKAGGEAIEPGISTAEIDKIIYDFMAQGRISCTCTGSRPPPASV